MTFNFNGNIPKKILFNNQNVRKLVYNNDVVWQKRRLPNEYQEVEYLESTGTQYIDTGYAFTNPNLEIEIKYRKNSSLGTNVFGLDLGTTPRKMHGHIYRNAVYLGKSSVIANIPQVVDTDYTFKFKFENDIATWVINEVEYVYNGANGWAGASVGETDYLFATRGATGVTYRMSGRIYYAKFYDNNGSLVRDFVPCYRKIDGEIGMYDCVNEVFYTNMGTGVFTTGKNINRVPNEYQEIEYIESTGIQYIDTGVSGECTVMIDCQGMLANNKSQIIVGSSASRGNYFAQVTTTGKYGLSTGGYGGLTDVIYTDRATFEIDFGNTQRSVTVNGETHTVTSFTANTNNYALFRAMAIVGSDYYYANARIYSCKMIQQDILVRDFVPCYRKADNVIGLYDVVNDDFYINIGSGTFIKGEDV